MLMTVQKLTWMTALICGRVQVKKWTAGQRNWSIVSMFLAVSNFAAAPTGSSLITKFFKQPSVPAQPPPAESSSTAQGSGSHSAVDEVGPVSDEGLQTEAVTLDVESRPTMLTTDEGLPDAASVLHPGLLPDEAHHAEAPISVTLANMQPASAPQRVHTLSAGLQVAAPEQVQLAEDQRQAKQSSDLQHQDVMLAAPSAVAQMPPALPQDYVDLQRAKDFGHEPAQPSALGHQPAAAGAVAEANAAQGPTHTGAPCLMGAFSGGEMEEPQSAAVQQGPDQGRQPVPKWKAALGKRPVEQAASKEPDHRKRPARCSICIS